MILTLAWAFLYTMVISTGLVVSAPFDPAASRFRWRMLKAWGAYLCRLGRLDVTVRGLENLAAAPGPAVFVSNHLSAYDIYVIASQFDRPTRFIAKYSVQFVPLVGWAMKSLRCSFMKRDRSRRDIEEIAHFAKRLREDSASVLVFAEGTRSKTGEMGAFKKGSFHVAKDAGVQIIPLCMVDSHLIKHHKNFWVAKPSRCELRIGKAISAEEVARLSVRELLERTRNAVVELHKGGAGA